jgi:drug/metabolite transporter (DMT)-like permease
MTLYHFFWGLACVVAISCGQILFKLASKDIVFEHSYKMLVSLMQNAYLMAGLLLYMATTLLWIGLLRVVDLRQAYPIMALAFIIVPVLGRYFLHEKLELNTILGGMVIVAGIWISVR